MAPYRIIFHDEDGEPVAESVAEHAHDDAAIDHAGSLGHPHEINVWQQERHVARFPPVARGLLRERSR